MTLSRNVVFVHIPKAGGTSVRTFIRSQVEEQDIFPEIDLHHFPRFERLAVSCPMLFMSHLGFEFVSDAQADALVLMRHPIERLLSLYSYATHPGENVPIIDPQLVVGKTFEEFFTSFEEAIRMNVDNAQTWQLASGYSARHRELRLANGTTPDRLIVEAKNNLARSAVVGTLEEMPEFYRAVGHYFGKAMVELPRFASNTSEKRVHWSDLSKEQKALVESCVSIEWPVYEYAKELAAKAASVL